MAPPKKDADTNGIEELRALAILMASSTVFEPDYEIVATALGINHAKNVPRKVDTILKPLGYQIKSKKVVKIGETPPPSTPSGGGSGSSAKAKVPRRSIAKKVKAEFKTVTPSAENNSDSDCDEIQAPAATSPKKKPAAKGKKAAVPKADCKVVTKVANKVSMRMPKVKKRKVEEMEEDFDDSDKDDEAMKLIKEKMGDGDDDNTTESESESEHKGKEANQATVDGDDAQMEVGDE